MISSYFKQYEPKLRMLLVHLFIEFKDEKEDPKKLKRYFSKISGRSTERVYEVVDEIFRQIPHIQQRVLLIKYGSLKNSLLDHDDVARVLGLKEREVRFHDKEVMQKLKSLDIKSSLEKLINQSS